MSLWERLLTAQVQGRAQARETARLERRPEPDQKPSPRTRIFQQHNYTIRRSEIILDETDGELEELMIKSTSEFSIELNVDGILLLHKSMTELISVSEDIGYIVAVLRDGYYRFSITDIIFEKIFMRVFLDGTGTFDIYRKVTLHGR